MSVLLPPDPCPEAKPVLVPMRSDDLRVFFQSDEPFKRSEPLIPEIGERVPGPTWHGF